MSCEMKALIRLRNSKEHPMKTLDIIVTGLLLAGALNWGLIGFFGVNLIAVAFGEAAVTGRVIYALVGIAAVYEIGCLTFKREETHHRWCETLTAVKH